MLNNFLASLPFMMETRVDMIVNAFLPMVKAGLMVSLPLAVASFLIRMVTAIAAVLIQIVPSGGIVRKTLLKLVEAHTSIIRGMPLLVQLVTVFYGLPSVGIFIDPILAVIIGFSLNVGAYTSETTRAAILSMPKGQWETGFSIGMTYTQTFRRIIAPQAFRVAVPPLSNELIGLFRNTSLAAVVMATESFRVAQETANRTYDFLPVYIEAALVYWCFRKVLFPIQARLESRFGRYVAKQGEAMIKIRNIRKTFGENTILRDIDLDVDKEQVVVILGPSGSGKTTFLHCLNALKMPEDGQIEFDSERPLKVDFSKKTTKHNILALRRKSGTVFQQYNLFPHKTALESVMGGSVAIQGKPAAQVREEVLKLLEKVGLGDKVNLYPYRFSDGQQQRVGIARALAIQPELTLFDEPTSALDPELVQDVLNAMEELAQEGWAMVVVTHEIKFVPEIVTTIVVMDGSVIVKQDSPKELFDHPKHERTRKFLQQTHNDCGDYQI